MGPDTDSGTATDTDDDEPPAGRRHHRGRWLALVAVVVLALLGAAAFLVLGGNPPDEASVEEARERFRPGDTAVEGLTPFERPAQGVYRYEGSGTESTSFPPVEESQGPSLPATVTWSDGGCWTFRIDYNTNHWQSWDYCPTEQGLFEHGGTTFQRRDYTVLQVESTSTFVCDPPSAIIEWDMAEGDVLDASCVGTNDVIDGETVSAGTNELVGIETIDVGGDDVQALRIRRTRTISGAQTGTETGDTWFAVETGLPLRQEHQIDVSTDTPFGAVDYAEDAEWRLTSMEPET